MKHRIKLYEFENTDEMYKNFYFTSKNKNDYVISYGVSFNKKYNFCIEIYKSYHYNILKTIKYKKFNVKIFEKAIYKLYKKYYNLIN